MDSLNLHFFAIMFLEELSPKYLYFSTLLLACSWVHCVIADQLKAFRL